MQPPGPGAARTMCGAVARWVLLCAAVVIVTLAVVYHQQLWKCAVGVAGALGTLAWSLAQKAWAARDKWQAWLADPPSKATPQTPGPPQTSLKPKELTMNLQATLAGLSGKLTLFFDALPEGAKAALATEIKDGAVAAVDAAAAEAKSLADQELAAAEAKAPAWSVPLLELGRKAAEAEIVRIREETDAKVGADAAAITAYDSAAPTA